MTDAGRETCLRCFKPRVACVCDTIARVANRTEVIILQHPRERGHPFGTVRFARLGLEIARTMPPLPAQTRVAQAQGATHVGNELCLGRSLRAQAVIDRGRFERNTTARGAFREKVKKRHGIAAARYGDAQAAHPIPFRPRTDLLAELCVGPGQLHPRPARADAASDAAGVPGKRTPTSPSVTQASVIWPRSPKATPSFISASGA